MSVYPVIMNPIAGGGRLLKQKKALEEAAWRNGSKLDWWYTEGPGHGEELAREAAKQGHSLVFSFGGDGSYNEVARGLAGSSCSLGILPGGTASVLVYELGIPRPPAAALEALLGGHDESMSAGHTNQGELFLLMVSAGPDAVVLERLVPSLKKWGGRFGIAMQGLYEVCFGSAFPKLKIECENSDVEGSWVTVGNCRRYAGAFMMTPGADPFAPGFEVLVLRSTGRMAVLSFVISLVAGRHLLREDVSRFSASHVSISAADGATSARYQVDGDISGRLPVEISSHPESILIRLP